MTTVTNVHAILDQKVKGQGDWTGGGVNQVESQLYGVH